MSNNALDKYLDSIQEYANWMPDPSLGSALDRDIVEQLEKRNAPNDWVAYASRGIMMVWEALPASFRTQTLTALQSIVTSAIQNISSQVSAVVNNITSTVEAMPVIGQLIAAAVDFLVRGISETKDEQRNTSELDLQLFRAATLFRYQDPNEWVYKRMKTENYLAFSGHVDKFYLRPVFRRTYKAESMFFDSDGLNDKGWCGDGVPYRCGEYVISEDWIAGHKECKVIAGYSSSNNCVRYTSISALFYPYWCPSYSVDPILLYGLQKIMENDTFAEFILGEYVPLHKREDVYRRMYDINFILSSRQMALLTAPDTNFRARGADIRHFSSNFKQYFSDWVKEKGLVPVDENGNWIGVAVEDRAVIDSAKKPAPLPIKSDPNKFYYRDDGIVVSYQSINEPLDRWGIPAKNAPGEQPNLAVTIAQYNAVLSATLAFFTARTQMLQNQEIMDALVRTQKNWKKEYDLELQAALEYAAAPQISIIPSRPIIPPPQRWTEPPDRMTKKKPVEPGLSTGAKVAIGAGVVGASYLAYRVIKKKKVKLPWQ